MALHKLPKELTPSFNSLSLIYSFKKAVQELVYNSLDANSTSIAVRFHIEENSIQVADNGFGMSMRDLKLVGQKYMTSKNVDSSTLKSLPNVYGYRGQALACLIKVSKMVKITSRKHDSEETWTKVFFDGKEKDVSTTVMRPSKGTTIEIKGFLYGQSIQKNAIIPLEEVQNIKQFLEQLSLVYNNVSLSLRDNSKNDIIFKLYKTRDIYQTLSSLFGIEKNNLQELKVEKKVYKVTAYIEKKVSEEKGQHLIYINGRVVNSSKLNNILDNYFKKALSLKSKPQKQTNNAINEGLDEVVQKHIPAYFIFITCPYADYDINYTSRQSFIEFNNWEHIKKLLEKLIDFYMGNLHMVKINEPTKIITKANQNPAMRDKVKDIVDKILATNARNLGVSQMDNGIKGKILKRKHQKAVLLKSRDQVFSVDKSKSNKIQTKCQGHKRSLNEKYVKTAPKSKPKPLPGSNSVFCSSIPNNTSGGKKVKIKNQVNHNLKIKTKSGKEAMCTAVTTKAIIPHKPIESKKNNKAKRKQHIMSKQAVKVTKLQKQNSSNLLLKFFENKTNTLLKKCEVVSKKVNSLLNRKKKIIKKGKITNHTNALKCENDNISEKIKLNNVTVQKNLNYLTKRRYTESVQTFFNDVSANKCKSSYELLKTITRSLKHQLQWSEKIPQDHIFPHLQREKNIRDCLSHYEKNIQNDIGWPQIMVSTTLKHKQEYVNNLKDACFKNIKSVGDCTQIADSPAVPDCLNSASSHLPKLTYESHTHRYTDLVNRKRVIDDSESYLERRNKHRFISSHSREFFNKLIDDPKKFLVQQTKMSLKNLTSTNWNIASTSYTIEFSKTSKYNINNDICRNNYEWCNGTNNLWKEIDRKSINQVIRKVYTTKTPIINNTYTIEKSSKAIQNTLTKEHQESLHENAISCKSKRNMDFVTECSTRTTIMNNTNTITKSSKAKQNISSKDHRESFRGSIKNSFTKEHQESIHENITSCNNKQNHAYTVNNQINFENSIDRHNNVSNIASISKSQNEVDDTVNPLEICQAIINASGQSSGDAEYNPTFDENDAFFDELMEKGYDSSKVNQNTNEILIKTSHHFDNNKIRNSNEQRQIRDIENFLQENNVGALLSMSGRSINIDVTSIADILNKEGKKFYLDKNTGMIVENTIDQQIAQNNFSVNNRPRFVPKGLSPIFTNCNTKNAVDYDFDKEYFGDTVYDEFVKEVEGNTEIFEPVIQDMKNLTTKEVGKFSEKVKKDNASLHFERDCLKHGKILGQVDDKFIAAIIAGKTNESTSKYLVLFDQHAVHERIRLESNLSDYLVNEQWKAATIDTVTIKLKTDDILYLHNYKEKFNQLGLQWTAANDSEISVSAIPEAILGKNLRQPEIVIKAVKNLIIEEIQILKLQKGSISLHPRSIMDLVFSEACRYAIKFGDRLSFDKCLELISNLGDCKTPFQCAHGRPVMAVLLDMKYTPTEYRVNFSKIKQFKLRYKANYGAP